MMVFLPRTVVILMVRLQGIPIGGFFCIVYKCILLRLFCSYFAMILNQLMEHCKCCVNLLNYKQTGIKSEAHKLKFGVKITDFNWYLHKLCKTVDIRR